MAVMTLGGARPQTPDVCSVCGLRYADGLPWGPSGTGPSFTLCDCCGVEFGYGDASVIAIKHWRERWLAGGAGWFDTDARPDDWSIQRQMDCIPAWVRTQNF